VGSQGRLWSRPVGSVGALRSKFSRRCALKQTSLTTQSWTAIITVTFHTFLTNTVCAGVTSSAIPIPLAEQKVRVQVKDLNDAFVLRSE